MPENLHGLRVVSFENRRAKEMAELIRRYGGEPIVAPAMRDVPLNENRGALDIFPEIESGKFDLLILMTGVGTRTLNQVLLSQYPQDKIVAALRKTQIVARGPKPVAALKELGLAPAITVPEPNTWREVLSAISAGMTLQGKHIAIQEYGVPNRELVAALEQGGASVKTIAVYRWALPEDLAPLRAAIEAMLRGSVHVALFTNGAQVEHLFRVATYDKVDEKLRIACKGMAIGSVGPICTQVLESFGLKPDVEPEHPKMGSLLAEVAASAAKISTEKRAAQT
ncbi:MAG TPA: uroporphyrinogen-III synthase [Candidatus Binatia bacterium]|nr:uroporphyrinogen-III synthase [Candidatus Binatia bacterium]